MRVIGVDPGTVCCGYGVVEAGDKTRHPVFVTSGDIRMSSRRPLPERLKTLYDTLGRIVGQYRPDHLCLEKIFYHKSIRSAFALGSTRGIVMLVAAENSIPVSEYNPTELKMALTGYGRAEKRQVKDMVMKVLRLEGPPESISDDSSDALALSICHVNASALKTLISPKRK
jgi:crossover junction endodeoxyribonuclease RuvC